MARYILPSLYFVSAIFIGLVYGDAGHGNGIAIVFFMSAPASFVAIPLEFIIPSSAVFVVLGGGIAQYFLIGYLLDKYVFGSKKVSE